MTRNLILASVLALAGGAAACGAEDSAAPVATPSVTVSTTDAAIGSPIDMTYRFAVAPDAPPFPADYWVFVHFLDSDGELMWTDDHAPPTPTTAWMAGETVEYERTMFIPRFPYVGDTRVQVGLFSPETGERLPMAGETDGQRAYVVARFNMRLQEDDLFVVFREGWYPAEVPPDGGIEWQWSGEEGVLSFRNPRADATLYLDLDQPAAALDEPQRVDVRIGDAVVDSFELPSGERQLRRIPVTAAQLGEGETTDVTVAVDRTFVPATVPSLNSADARVLGVRVFRAYVAAD